MIWSSGRRSHRVPWSGNRSCGRGDRYPWGTWVASQPGPNEAILTTHILTTHIVDGPWSRSFLGGRRLWPDFQFGRVRGALDIGDGEVERPFRLLEQLGINRPRLERYTLTQPIS